jgi:hypothetical protein
LVVRVASGELENQAVPEEQADQVVPAELVLRIVQVLAQALEIDPAAAQAKTKLVTVAHRHGQVRAPKRVEDLVAAAAEIMREPAAIEVAKAWAAAE